MSAALKVLLTGRDGQLGQALSASTPQGINLISCGRAELDLADASACAAAVHQHRPDWVLNAGAYTAVDRAEQEPELALAVTGGRLLQVSTDFVFNGQQGCPYQPEQPVDPLGVYGRSKAAGERLARAALPPDRCCVLRTSWVYGPVGKNFCLTMLRLHGLRAEAGAPLSVVADQVGCPTSTHTLAAACWAAISCQASGVLHWSDAGAASWYDFAVAIGELGAARGLLVQPALVLPIGSDEYPTPAQRPSYSLLDCTSSRQLLNRPPLHWRTALDQVLAQLSAS